MLAVVVVVMVLYRYSNRRRHHRHHPHDPLAARPPRVVTIAKRVFFVPALVDLVLGHKRNRRGGTSDTTSSNPTKRRLPLWVESHPPFAAPTGVA
jgi:hypothetical protein